jgi:hypothetical protein
MKTHKLIIIAAVLLMPFMAGAQALKGSYFIDNSLNRNKMNPAFAPRSNYFQMPALGNLSAGVMSNLDVPTFLYPMNGELVTFLNSQVSVKQFERALPNHPHLDAETSANLINFGFYTKQNSFWTFDLGIRAGVDSDLPADLFLFLKKGAGTSGRVIILPMSMRMLLLLFRPRWDIPATFSTDSAWEQRCVRSLRWHMSP